MAKPIEIPDCYYPEEAALVCPSGDTPKHSLYLSNIDTQHSLRPNTLRYVFLYNRPLDVHALRASLSKALVLYYPFAGRLTPAGDDARGLLIDCNGEGALFAHGSLDLTAAEFLDASRSPNYSWMKLLYQGGADGPPLVVQVLHLTCGSVLLCVAFSHCLCDGVGSALFLQAWARMTACADLPNVTPFHDRGILKPRQPPRVDFSHPEYCIPRSDDPKPRSPPDEPLVPIILTFGSDRIQQFKKLHCPSGKCTAFEAVASHIWCAWVRSLDLPPSHLVRLGFSINVRRRLDPELPPGYYGNGFVLGCIETFAGRLVAPGASRCVELIRRAKERVTDGYVRSVIDLLEGDRVRLKTSMVSLIISQWSKLGLEGVDFGEGRPIYVGPQYPPLSHRVCLLLPVIGDPDAVTMWMSFPLNLLF